MDGNAEQLAKVLKVLSVGTRVRIVQLLKGRALCVNALACRLDVTQGAVSQHLRVLRDAGVVIDEKRGYFVHYRLNEEVLAVWRADIGLLLGAGIEDRDNKGDMPCAAATRTSKGVRNRRV
ncbi:MAG: winged helix-turn-helix transcriptional regulator [Phycisphaerae bacterium]|nr:winged helix-turn-helix transcriptional regulator [Phycisphaerae bacterium]